MPNGLETFRDVVADFRSVAGLATKAAVAVPIADLFMDFGPPWPPFISVLTSVVELLVLIIVFEFWYTSPRRTQRRRMLLFGSSALLCLFAYLLLTSEFTANAPTGDRFAIGYRLRADAALILQPGEEPRDLLEQAEYRPERVWTSGSISVIRLSLVASWLLAFAFLAGFIAVFVVIQRRRRK